MVAASPSGSSLLEAPWSCTFRRGHTCFSGRSSSSKTLASSQQGSWQCQGGARKDLPRIIRTSAASEGKDYSQLEPQAPAPARRYVPPQLREKPLFRLTAPDHPCGQSFEYGLQSFGLKIVFHCWSDVQKTDFQWSPANRIIAFRQLPRSHS